MKRANGKAPRFHVGDRVRVLRNRRLVSAEVVEDLGPVGMRGRRLYRVDVFQDPYDPFSSVRPEEELKPEDPVEQKKPLDRKQSIDFFKNGGLAWILSTFGPDGKLSPRVWLRRDNLGNVTYTFVQDRGLIGGATVPHPLTLDDLLRVRLAEKDAVIKFLGNFGLSPQDAEEVIQAVGTTRR